MKKITIILCLVSFSFAAIKNSFTCPSTKVTSKNLPDAQLIQKNTVLTLINSGFPGVTDLGKCYFEILKTYLSGDDVTLQNQVINSVVWQTSLLSNFNGKNNACNMAQMINATVDCFGSGSSCSMLKAIPMMETSIYESIDFYATSNQQASGCQTQANVSRVRTSNSSCLNNGYTYKIEEIWKLRGKNLPIELRDIVIKLYKSCDFTDNFIALMATNSLLPINGAVTLLMVGFPAAVEFINMRVNSSIPYCCCKARFKRIDELSNQIKRSIDCIVNDQMKTFQAPGACSSTPIFKKKKTFTGILRK